MYQNLRSELRLRRREADLGENLMETYETDQPEVMHLECPINAAILQPYPEKHSCFLYTCHKELALQAALRSIYAAQSHEPKDFDLASSGL
jgi:hypothetical protein